MTASRRKPAVPAELARRLAEHNAKDLLRLVAMSGDADPVAGAKRLVDWAATQQVTR